MTDQNLRYRRVVSGVVLLVLTGLPLAVAVLSPLQTSRNAAYIIGGLAGVAALGILLLQPILAAGFIPGTHLSKQRRWHSVTGGLLIALVLVHVIGLYLTSPPDMIDALLLVAPTLYSVYGVIALWGVILLGIVALPLIKKRIKPTAWRLIHHTIGVIVVGSTVTHAVMIDGAMGWRSKLMLCIAAVLATLTAIVWLRWIRARHTT